MIRYKITFVGAGNVASALIRVFFEKGHQILRIVSQDENRGHKLARLCNATWSGDYIIPDATEILIVAVPDHKLQAVLNNIRCNQSVTIAHTAGSLGLDLFPVHVIKKGVIYPLQTFSGNRKPDLSIVPFFIEGSDDDCTAKLKSLADSISNSVYLSDTIHRRLLHLAAVYVCNFTNHLLTTGKDISALAEFPFEVLQPLILETISKAIETGPENSQTGPAVRNDLNTIEKHLELLSFNPDLKTIYDLMTKSIISYYK